MYMKKYFAILVLRFALVLMPQNGYIHPDEYFQGPEVIAGEVFDIRVRKTWEFRTKLPIRSMAVLSITTRLSMLIYNGVLKAAGLAPDAFSLLLTPRIFHSLLHLSCDLVVFLLCRQLGLDAWRGLFFYGFSYTALILGTRTLANSVESSLLALLVCTVLANHQLSKPSHSILRLYVNVVQGVILVLGFFNRPTFAVFAAPALIMDLYEGVVNHKLMWRRDMVAKIIGSAYCLVTCVALDSSYYRPNFFARVSHLALKAWQAKDLSFGSLSQLFQDLSQECVLTPLNFILYNTRTDSLAQHGLHPWYTHLLGSVPGLLGPAALCLVTPLLTSTGKWARLCHATLVFPLMVLSAVPHQEARFLLPCAPFGIVLAYLLLERRWPFGFNRALFVWAVYNVPAAIFFGFLHQGGLTPMLQHLSEVVRVEQSQRCHVLVFYHTYMPPRHLLLFPRRLVQPLNTAPCLHVEDLAGGPPEALTAAMQSLHARLHNSEFVGNASVHVVFPVGLARDVRLAVHKNQFQLRYMARVNGHFSGEDPPHWNSSLSWKDALWNYWDQMAIMNYEFQIIRSKPLL